MKTKYPSVMCQILKEYILCLKIKEAGPKENYLVNLRQMKWILILFLNLLQVFAASSYFGDMARREVHVDG